jgi:hypothetical protein
MVFIGENASCVEGRRAPDTGLICYSTRWTKVSEGLLGDVTFSFGGIIPK